MASSGFHIGGKQEKRQSRKGKATSTMGKEAKRRGVTKSSSTRKKNEKKENDPKDIKEEIKSIEYKGDGTPPLAVTGLAPGETIVGIVKRIEGNELRMVSNTFVPPSVYARQVFEDEKIFKKVYPRLLEYDRFKQLSKIPNTPPTPEDIRKWYKGEIRRFEKESRYEYLTQTEGIECVFEQIEDKTWERFDPKFLENLKNSREPVLLTDALKAVTSDSATFSSVVGEQEASPSPLKHNATLAFQTTAWALKPPSVPVTYDATKTTVLVYLSAHLDHDADVLVRSTTNGLERHLQKATRLDETLFLLEKDPVDNAAATRFSKDTYSNNDSNVAALVMEVLNMPTVDGSHSLVMNEVQKTISGLDKLPLSALKSTLQKIIRFAPSEFVEFPNPPVKVNVKMVLVVVAIRMMCADAAFDPTVRRWERGLHAFVKRLFVILIEDAWLVDHGHQAVADLVAASILSNNDPEWFPPMIAVKRWLGYALKALESNVALKCRHSKDDQLTFENSIGLLPVTLYEHLDSSSSGSHHMSDAISPGSLIKVVSYLFDKFVPGMKGDHAMVRCVALKTTMTTESSRTIKEQSMPLHHVVDQHWAPEAAYFLNPVDDTEAIGLFGKGTNANDKEARETPFGRLFEKWFDWVTGYNPRRTKASFITDDNRNFWKAIDKAQKLYLNHFQFGSNNYRDGGYGYRTQMMDIDPDTSIVEWLAPPGWVACALGTIKVTVEGNDEEGKKKNFQLYVTIRPDDLTELVVITQKTPKKTTSTTESLPEIPEDVRGAAIACFKKLLASPNGIKIPATLGTVRFVPPNEEAFLYVSADFFDDDDDASTKVIKEYKFRWDRGTEWQSWETFRTSRFPIPNKIHLLRCADVTSKAYLSTLPDSIVDNDVAVVGLITKMVDLKISETSKRMFAMALKSAGDIVFPPIARDGGSVGQSDPIPTMRDLEMSFLARYVAAHMPTVLRTTDRARTFATDKRGFAIRSWFGDQLLRALNTVTLTKRERRITTDPNSTPEQIFAMSSNIAAQYVTDYIEKRGFALFPYQTECLETLIERHLSGNTTTTARGHFLWLANGTGKTAIVGAFVLYLDLAGELPSYVVFWTPGSALRSIAENLGRLGIQCVTLVDKSEKSNDRTAMKIEGNQPFVYIGDQEVLKTPYYEGSLLNVAQQALVIFDEVHMSSNLSTKRSRAAVNIATVAKEMIIAMTGTPLSNKKTEGLQRWLSLCVDFPITNHSFLVAANAMMIAREITLPTKKVEIEVELTDGQNDDWFLPLRMGGTAEGSVLSNADFKTAYIRSQDACVKKMLELAVDLIVNKKKKVFIVAEDKARTDEIGDALIKKLKEAGRTGPNVFVSESGKSIPSMTPKDLEENKIPPYLACVIPLSQNAGYNATIFDTMITGVYPSNIAKRIQIRGRIYRTGQRSPVVTIYTVHAGLVTFIHRNHLDAQNLEAALAQVATTAGKTIKGGQ